MGKNDKFVDKPKLGQIMTNLVSVLVNISYEFGQLMIKYDLLWARRVILSNVRTDSNLT